MKEEWYCHPLEVHTSAQSTMARAWDGSVVGAGKIVTSGNSLYY